jgi:hypothetical protein
MSDYNYTDYSFIQLFATHCTEAQVGPAARQEKRRSSVPELEVTRQFLATHNKVAGSGGLAVVWQSGGLVVWLVWLP